MPEQELKKRQKNQIWLKFLKKGGRARIARFKWKLPKNGKKGPWMPAIDGPIKTCEHGYHLTTLVRSQEWFEQELYLAEPRSLKVGVDYDVHADCPDDRTTADYDFDTGESDKIAVRQARLIRRVEEWNPQTLRKLIVICALKISDHKAPNPQDCKRAGAIIRPLLDGRKLSRKELQKLNETVYDMDEEGDWFDDGVLTMLHELTHATMPDLLDPLKTAFDGIGESFMEEEEFFAWREKTLAKVLNLARKKRRPRR